jgi:hypothetical protein
LCFDADQHTAKNAECKRIMPNFRLQVATHNLLNCLVHLHGHDALTCWNNAFDVGTMRFMLGRWIVMWIKKKGRRGPFFLVWHVF